MFCSNAGRMLDSIHGTGQIWLDNVVCRGDETNLGDCKHSEWGDHNCRHTEDVTIDCSDNSQPANGMQARCSLLLFFSILV